LYRSLNNVQVLADQHSVVVVWHEAQQAANCEAWVTVQIGSAVFIERSINSTIFGNKVDALGVIISRRRRKMEEGVGLHGE